MTCQHLFHRLMGSVDYPNKIYCKDCDKRFELVEWLSEKAKAIEGELRTHGECDHPNFCAGKCDCNSKATFNGKPIDFVKVEGEKAGYSFGCPGTMRVHNIKNGVCSVCCGPCIVFADEEPRNGYRTEPTEIPHAPERDTPEKILGKCQVYDLDCICRDIRSLEERIMGIENAIRNFSNS